MVATIGALVSPHDLTFGVNAACKAVHGSRKINRSEAALAHQEAVKLAVGAAVPAHNLAPIVDPVSVRNAAAEPAAGEDVRYGAGVIETTETAFAQQEAVRLDSACVEVNPHDVAC